MAAPTIKVDIVSAEEQIFSGEAEFVVLPGIMGSELKRRDAAADQPVWLSLRSMLGGRLGDLELDAADKLEASGLLAVSYERLLERAPPRFDAVAVPYDWRHPICASGSRTCSPPCPTPRCRCT